MQCTRWIIVFDVNETLLDIGALEPHFVRAFGDGAALREGGFSTVLLYSEVATLAGIRIAGSPSVAQAITSIPSRVRSDRMSPSPAKLAHSCLTSLSVELTNTSKSLTFSDLCLVLNGSRHGENVATVPLRGRPSH
jgi:hypothetical protein